MKNILNINDCPEIKEVIAGGQTLFVKEKDLFNSCRFCSSGRGIYKVFDDTNNEAFYLCEKHKKQYDLGIDKITDLQK